MLSPKARLFWPIAIVWLALDIVTKRLALAHLWPPGVPHEFLGEYARFTLAFNRGAAMGLSLGEWSRPFFSIVGLLILGVLFWLYHQSAPESRLKPAVLAFVVAGAIGNLIDRFRWEYGVVDFIDLGIGTVRFWTFNVADMGISLGAIALAFILGREEPPAEAGSG